MELRTKKQVLAAMNLVTRFTWLGEKSEALHDLLFEDCTNDDQRELMTELFDRFLFITQAQLAGYVHDLAEEIATSPGLEPENTIIAAMAQDSAPDSSQMLLQMIKTQLQDIGWGNVKLANLVGDVYKRSKESNFSRLNIVIIDEFIGSGKTAIQKKKFIEKQFSQTEFIPKIIIKVIFCSSVGAANLRLEGVNFDSIREVKRGISDFEEEPQASEKIMTMRNIEDGLSDEEGDHVMAECSLGYGGTESLFAIEKGNIPNSVFPILWWPNRKCGTARKALFTRWIGGK